MTRAASKALWPGWAVAVLLASIAFPAAIQAEQKPKDVPGLLREIRREVAEMGGYPGEDFVRRDFSLGEDDDDTNRNHHVGILIQDRDGGTVMTIRITKLEPTARDPNIRYGKEGRMIVCRFSDGEVEMTRSDLKEGDLKPVLAEVLEAVREKKKLLRK